MATSDQIQQLYIAYFGRPADPAGLSFYVSRINNDLNGDFKPIMSDFFASTEYRTLYNFDISRDDGRRAAVSKVYENLLNREPDAGGLKFYMDKLAANPSNGLSTLVLDVLFGARNDDLRTIDSKLVAANAFTARLDRGVEQAAYGGKTAAEIARDFLKQFDAKSVDRFQPSDTDSDPVGRKADEFIVRLQNEATVGNFTKNVDNVRGTQGQADNAVARLNYLNGVFDSESTLNNGDMVNLSDDSGEFFDVATVNITGARLSSSTRFDLALKSVERVVINNQETDVNADVTLNLNDIDGRLETVTLGGERLQQNTDNRTIVTGLGKLVAAEFQLRVDEPNSNAALESQVNTITRSLEINYDGNILQSKSDTMTVKLSGATLAPNFALASVPRLVNYELKASGVEQLLVRSEAAGVPGVQPIRNLVIGNTAEIEKIAVVQNDAPVVRIDASAVGRQLKEFDGSQSSGSIILDVGSGLNAAQNLRGSKFSTNDILSITAPEILTRDSLAAISDFDILRLESGSSGMLDAGLIRGLRGLELRATANGDKFSVKNIVHRNDASPEVLISRDSVKTVGLDVTLSTETVGNVDQALTVGITADVSRLNVANSRSVVLSAQGPQFLDTIDPLAAKATVSELNLTGATSLVFSEAGGRKVQIGKIIADDLRVIRAESAEQSLNMTDFVNKSGSAPLDILGGAAGDRIFGSNQEDTVYGRGGVDIIDIKDGAEAKRDRIVFESASEFGDTVLNFSNGSATATDTGDLLVFSRALMFGASEPSSAAQRQFGPTTTTTNGGLLTGPSTTTTPDTRIESVSSGSTGRVDGDDVIALLSNANRQGAGLMAVDLEGDFTKLTEVVNTKLTAAGSSNRFVLFVSNDVDTFAFQFTRAASGEAYTLAGGAPVVKLLGISDTTGFDQFDFELIG